MKRWEYEIQLLRNGREPRAFAFDYDTDDSCGTWDDYEYDLLYAHDCLDDGDGFRVDPLDIKLLRHSSPKAALLLEGLGKREELIANGDRSSALWHVLQSLKRAGYGPGVAFLSVWNSPVGEKPREKGRDWFVEQLQVAYAYAYDEHDPRNIEAEQRKQALRNGDWRIGAGR